MLPVTVRFTPTAAELQTVRSALLEGRARPSLPLSITLSVLFIAQGVLHLAYHDRDSTRWLAYMQIVLGVVYGPLSWSGRYARLSFAKAEHENQFEIDDAGIAIADCATLIPWKRIKTIRDVGGAFVFESTWDRRIAILKRALPDDGRSLWATLDAKLTATRYLVRGTDSRRRISNGLET